MGDKLFISYRRDDSRASTESIYRALLPHFGRDQIFFDVDSIPGGVNFAQLIQQTLAQCAVVLVVVGPKWVDIAQNGVRRLDDPGDYVRLEVKTALDAGLRVIPVLVEGTRMPRAEQLPEALRQFALMNARQVRYAPDFDVDIGRLVKAIEEGGAPTLAIQQARAQEAARLAQTEAERQRQLAYQQDLARQQAAWQVIQAEQARQTAAAATEWARREQAVRAPLPWRFALLTALVIGVPSVVAIYLAFGHLPTASSTIVPDGFALSDSLYFSVLSASFVLPGMIVAARVFRLVWSVPREAWSASMALRVTARAVLVGIPATIVASSIAAIGAGWGALRTLANPNVYAGALVLGLIVGSLSGAITSGITAFLLLLARRADLAYARLRNVELSSLSLARWVVGLGLGLLCGLLLGALGYLNGLNSATTAVAATAALYAVATIVPAVATAMAGGRTAPALLAALVCMALVLAVQQVGFDVGGALHLNPHDVSGQENLFTTATFAAVAYVLAAAPIGLLAAWVTLLVRGAVAGRRAPAML